MNTLNNIEINIGIDTSQTQLDIYVRPQGHFVSFANTAIGVKDAIKYIKGFDACRILIESTGRLEM